MKKRLFHKQITSIVLLVTAFSLTACGVSKPSDVLEKVESAYNSRDTYKMIECFEPKVQNFVKGATDMLGGVFGLDGMGDMLPFLVTLNDAHTDDGDKDFGTIELKENSSTITGDTAVIQCSAKVTYENGEEEFSDGEFHLVKVDGEWYLSMNQ